jgi:hypothetical protein
LNVGNTTVLSANNTGLYLVPSGNVSVNIGGPSANLALSTINVSSYATIANSSITRNNVNLNQYGTILSYLNASNTNGFILDASSGSLGLRADIQNSGGYGLSAFRNTAIPTSTTVNICRTHWGGLALVSFAGSGVQGFRLVTYGYNNSPTVLYSANWVGSLSTTFSAATYDLRVSHTNGSDVEFWGVFLGA